MMSNQSEKDLKERAEGIYFEADVIRAWVKQLNHRAQNMMRTMISENKCHGIERHQLDEMQMVLENCLEQLQITVGLTEAIESRAREPEHNCQRYESENSESVSFLCRLDDKDNETE